jgi:hypothetical protein
MRKPWVFIPLALFKENEKSFGNNWDNASSLGKSLEGF